MKITFNIITLFILFQSLGQNLVPNPSFETYSLCPDQLNQVSRATGWESFGDTPDYYNVCNNFATVNMETYGVPNNYYGYQYAASGDAYCSFISWVGDNSNYREFIGSELLTPLDSGVTYCVSMKLNFPYREGNPCWNTAIKNMGIRFTNTQYSESSPHPVDDYCHVCADEFIYDTLNWHQVSGTFTPSQSYQYIVLGNFYSDVNSDTMTLFPFLGCGNASAYYVDDIIVSLDSTYCDQESVGVIEPSPSIKKIVRIIDSMGREAKDKQNTLLIYIYSDGTVEKVYRIQ